MRGMQNLRHDCFLGRLADSLADIRGRLPLKKGVGRLTEKIGRLGFAPTPAPQSPGTQRPKTGADGRSRIWEC